ncbi:ParA family protein [Corynebacterium sp. SA-MJD20WY100]|uniref:ParA family protein n=1 Tax=Corynebacterium sp. SA-MJD20WY100 TaxID=3142969 RepID=UPI003221DC33
MIITTINAKGGVGKTTSTMFLATVFAQRGIPVTVTDLDRQGSALDWAERAEDGGDPLPFNVELSIPKRVDRQAALVADNEMMLIDVPPGDENAIEAAIAVSDFIIMPTRSAAADLSRVWELRDAVGGTPHAVLLTFARKGTSALEAAREALEAEDMPHFETEIPLREDMHLAFGYCPGPDMHGYDKVADEIMEMMK